MWEALEILALVAVAVPFLLFVAVVAAGAAFWVCEEVFGL